MPNSHNKVSVRSLTNVSNSSRLSYHAVRSGCTGSIRVQNSLTYPETQAQTGLAPLPGRLDQATGAVPFPPPIFVAETVPTPQEMSDAHGRV